jgi:hypothetical protein
MSNACYLWFIIPCCFLQMLFKYDASKEELAAMLAFLTGSCTGIRSFSSGCIIKVSVENIE